MVEVSRIRIVAGCGISLQDWEDGVILFHENSGNTHLLNEISAAGLRVLMGGEIGDEAFYTGVSDKLDVADNEEFRVIIGMLLKQLEQLQLIEWVR